MSMSEPAEKALQVDLARHPCAVCERPIIHAFLMCGQHWRLVPAPQQLAVYRTWGALTAVVPRGRRAAPHVVSDYLAAKDAAIASARAALGQTPFDNATEDAA
jgi:hypothetical protein